MVSFIDFRNKLIGLGCFSLNQIKVAYPEFHQNNIVRWCKQGLLWPLRQSWYVFPECMKEPDFERYIACKIYDPSYISLQYALCFYDLIPEAVTDITSVTTLKTSCFENEFGHYNYKSLKPSMFFGYKPMINKDGKGFFLATPEKAILDFLYLYPQYKTEEDMVELRFDEDFLEDELDWERFNDYLKRMNCKALTKRAKLLKRAYNLE